MLYSVPAHKGLNGRNGQGVPHHRRRAKTATLAWGPRSPNLCFSQVDCCAIAAHGALRRRRNHKTLWPQGDPKRDERAQETSQVGVEDHFAIGGPSRLMSRQS